MKKLNPSRVEAPSLELRPLLEDLNHAFLGPKEIFLAVNIVHLDENRDEHSLSVLRTQKRAPTKQIKHRVNPVIKRWSKPMYLSFSMQVLSIQLQIVSG